MTRNSRMKAERDQALADLEAAREALRALVDAGTNGPLALADEDVLMPYFRAARAALGDSDE